MWLSDGSAVRTRPHRRPGVRSAAAGAPQARDRASSQRGVVAGWQATTASRDFFPRISRRRAITNRDIKEGDDAHVYDLADPPLGNLLFRSYSLLVEAACFVISSPRPSARFVPDTPIIGRSTAMLPLLPTLVVFSAPPRNALPPLISSAFAVFLTGE